jgi:chromosome segregation protein
MNAIYKTTMEMLSDVIAARALRPTLDEGIKKLGKTEDNVAVRDMEKVLKANIYKQLQVALPAANAKARIQQILDALTAVEAGVAPFAPATAPAAESRNPTGVPAAELERQGAQLGPLEDGLKRFNLYFEWPEVQKFRAQLQVIRDQHAAGQLVGNPLKDAQSQLDQLERKLQDLLVRQAREIAEIQGDLERVRSVGGPKVRRLESLITQITQAQTSSTLAPAEVERARKLAVELRKLIESSVVSPSRAPTMDEGSLVVDDIAGGEPATGEFLLDVEFADTDFALDFSDLSPEQSERVREIDLSEDERQLDALEMQYRAVIEATADFGVAIAELRRRNANREIVGEELPKLRANLDEQQKRLLAAQKTRLAEIPALLDRYRAAGLDVGEVGLTLNITESQADNGILANDDMATLDDLLRTLERQFQDREKAKSEETARVARQLARQETLVGEMQRALAGFGPLGAASGGFGLQLLEFEAETKAGRLRDDLVRSLGEEAGRLQQQLELLRQAEVARQAEAQVAARAQAEAEAAAQGEAARLAQAHAEAQRLAQSQAEAQRQAKHQAEGNLLRNLRMTLSALPDLPQLETQMQQIGAGLEAAAAAFERGQSITNALPKMQAQVAALGTVYRQTFIGTLAELEEQANEQGAEGVQESIAEAKRVLEAGQYPDLASIEAALRAEREARLIVQRRELAELETAVKEYTSLPMAVMVIAEIGEARSAHEAGRVVSLESAWAGVDGLRAAEEAALNSWGTKVDKVIQEAEQYRSVGGETVRHLTRLAEILRTERSGGRGSSESRSRLEKTLQEANGLLVQARQEYEAAQMVASALKDTSQIDDLLGVFSFGFNPTLSAPKEEPKPVPLPSAIEQARPEASASLGGELRQWLENISDERGVAQVTLLRADGALRFGRSPRPGKLAEMLVDAERYSLEMARELQRQPARVFSTESLDGSIIGMFLRPSINGAPAESNQFEQSGQLIVIVLEDVSLFSRIFAQVYRDYSQLQAWV